MSNTAAVEKLVMTSQTAAKDSTPAGQKGLKDPNTLVQITGHEDKRHTKGYFYKA